MAGLDPSSWPLGWVFGVFALGAGLVWFAGVRLSRYAAAVSDRTGIGQAFVGILLLGGITSLPEIAVSTVASIRGSAPLAVNNLLGGIAMQVAILAAADAALGRAPLTVSVTRATVMLQGTLELILLLMIALAIALGDTAVAGLGAWSLGVTGTFLGALWLVHRAGQSPGWHPADRERTRDSDSATRQQPDAPAGARLIGAIVLVSAVILIAGYVLSRTGEVIADRTGLGESFVGAVLLAISTSLPELSTVIGAARDGNIGLAFGDVFGANMFDAGLLLLVDALYAGGPVLNAVGRFSLVAALLGAAITAVYLVGLLLRREPSVGRLGLSSILALLTYGGGLLLLYRLR